MGQFVSKDTRMSPLELASSGIKVLGTDPHSENKTVSMIPSRLLGRIVHLGPTELEMVSVIRRTPEWTQSLLQLMPPEYRPYFWEQSDLFIRTFDKFPPGELDETIISIKGHVGWSSPNLPTSIAHTDQVTKYTHPTNAPCSKYTTAYFTQTSQEYYNEWKTPPSFCSSRLFVVQTLSNPPFAIGLAPNSAEVGDCICQLDGEKTAALVRVDPVYDAQLQLRLVGTAGMAMETIQARNEKKRRGHAGPRSEDYGAIFDTPRFSTIRHEEKINLFMETTTAHNLFPEYFLDRGCIFTRFTKLLRSSCLTYLSRIFHIFSFTRLFIR
ncbi:hypothetical protein PVAG01_08618 [Phlyctema vagabunda]|uniref:Uncharacterized protein n=1 Tax=Phlyctema vagabunda TaxID=108571 RepID=A0ABR4PA08_9HELO